MAFFSNREAEIFGVVRSKKLSESEKIEAVGRILIWCNLQGVYEEREQLPMEKPIEIEIDETIQKLEPLLRKAGVCEF